METPKIGLPHLTRTIPSAFSSFYLTLVAMIQGVALGLLAAKIPGVLAPFGAVGFLYALLTFTVIVVVWHEYVLAAQEFWWKLTLWDSVVPFLLGMGQFLMIEYLGKENYVAWFFAASFSAFTGFFAYINYDRWLRLSDFDDPSAFTLFKSEVSRGRRLLLVLAIVDLLFGATSYWSSSRHTIFLLGLAHGAFLIAMVYRRLAWLRKALTLYGWAR